MEIIKIETGPDCKIITCICYNWSPQVHPKTMRFLGDNYEKTGWDAVKRKFTIVMYSRMYIQFTRPPVPLN